MGFLPFFSIKRPLCFGCSRSQAQESLSPDEMSARHRLTLSLLHQVCVTYKVPKDSSMEAIELLRAASPLEAVESKRQTTSKAASESEHGVEHELTDKQQAHKHGGAADQDIHWSETQECKVKWSPSFAGQHSTYQVTDIIGQKKFLSCENYVKFQKSLSNMTARMELSAEAVDRELFSLELVALLAMLGCWRLHACNKSAQGAQEPLFSI
eukprot:gnl/TRDRNA2_/TRDRNA2_168626_c0_seq1.p1 gnl/TRDRNA2_/TRDRNA2_168626_c0~~gnl/TRDRNA2_/TRDRNA2_168626_c0_seq1.p1  ORF type:complete len:211 (+),score=43.30 gnl/TRDRNA2_/TRDRNA2_168626_c0_seq1:63-695(+)